MITDTKMQFWIENNLNVLFIGEHGVGKTARVKKAFDEANLKWLYFSAATLDPWVDFIGIPKEVEDPETGKKYIDLIRPRPFAEDEVEAIFIDELNRSHKKVRNAIMELLQFKSINGKKFNNLRIIWGAINPENSLDDSSDLEYDVDRLDPAQKDRFEVHVDVPFKPDKAYFLEKFGNLANPAIEWWQDIGNAQRKTVSPRRLDYALSVYSKGGDLRDVLPAQVNISKLIDNLKNNGVISEFNEIFKERNVDRAKQFLSNRNNFTTVIDRVKKNDQMVDFFLPILPAEDVVILAADNDKVFQHLTKYSETIYFENIKSLIKSNPKDKLVKKLLKFPVGKKIVAEEKASALQNLKFAKFTNVPFKWADKSYYPPVTKNIIAVVGPYSTCRELIQLAEKKYLLTNQRMGVINKIASFFNNNDGTHTVENYIIAVKAVSRQIEYFQEGTIKKSDFIRTTAVPFFGYLMNRIMASDTNKSYNNWAVELGFGSKINTLIEHYINDLK